MAAWRKSKETLFGRIDLSYRESYLRKDIYQANTVIVIVAILVLAYTYTDYQTLHSKVTGYALTRMAFFAASVWMVALLRKTHNVKFADLAILIWGIALISVAFFISLRKNILSIEQANTIHLWILCFYLILPNRLPFKLIPAFLLSLIDISILADYIHLRALSTTDISIFSNASTVLALNIIGVFVARRFEEQRYHEYLIQKTLIAGQEQLKLIATTDSLTGILNRRGFFELAEIEFDRFQRYQTTFSFAILDVDKLKTINDVHGHPAGDQALQVLIEFLNQNKRSSDIFGRLAGDEFGLILPGTPIDTAHHLIARIHKQLATQEVVLPDEKVVAVRFSAGITEVNTEDKNFDDIYRRADDALLSAKSKGRNLIEKA